MSSNDEENQTTGTKSNATLLLLSLLWHLYPVKALGGFQGSEADEGVRRLASFRT